MYFRKYRDVTGQWRWTLYAANGRKIADSGESYGNEANCDYAIQLVRSAGSALLVSGFVAQPDLAHEPETPSPISEHVTAPAAPGLKDLLAAAPLEGIDLSRDGDTGRDVDL